MQRDTPGSPSPERGISRLLRKKGGADSPNSSLAPSDSFSEQGGLRASIDRGLDKFKDKTSRRGSTEVDRQGSEDSSATRRLSKLVPKRSRRKKKNDTDEDSNGDNNGLGVQIPTQNNSKLNLPSYNASNESLGRDKSGGSSLLTTEDSDSDLPVSSRPDFASRASHKGYLTFSSPLIAAETVETQDPLQSIGAAQPASLHPPDGPSGLEETTKPVPLDRSVSPTGPFRDVLVSSVTSAAASGDLARPIKASTYPTKLEDQTPASASSTKPSIRVSTFPDDRPGTPSTLVTPPTPVADPAVSPSRSQTRTSFSPGTHPTKPVSAVPKDSITHRRTRSAIIASKSGTIPPPLTPHIEEAKTPGGSVIQPSNSSGFFSSVFSATQNAVTQFNNTFGSQPQGQRSRSTTLSSEVRQEGEGETPVQIDRAVVPDAGGTKVQERETAVATLGTGNLSLTHLGITDGPTDTSAMATKPETFDGASRSRASTQNAEASIRSEEASVAEAVSAAYSAKEPSEKSVPVYTDNSSVGGRPRSIGSGGGTIAGDATPPPINTAQDTDSSSIRRTGSVRSRLSGSRKRGRNPSSGGAIAAALAASHGAIANPASRRPAGLTLANSKRNKDFHQFFKSIPEDDQLVEDYSAALQREILLQGRFYVTEKHICFSSNILGWVTNLVINFDEVVAMEKKSTAMIFPNAIVIQTLHAKNVFASFISRDPTYDQLIKIWRINHPNLKNSDNGHVLDESADVAKVEQIGTPETDESGDESEGDEEIDAGDDDIASSIGRPASIAASEGAETTRVVSRALGPTTSSPGAAPNGSPEKQLGAAAATSSAQDYPGPTSHAPTECGDQETHFDKLVLDTVVPAPLGKVYTMMFGPASGTVMRKFLVDDQKSGDLQLEDDKKGLGEDSKTVTYSYIKPLGGSIGPKQTKCLVTQNLDAFDLERAVSVTCSTQTPDVPSGSVFVTKTRYCLMWGPGNSTRLLMSCVVEWSGKSWLKGPIEKGANDGQTQYGKDIAAYFKTQVATKPPTKVSKGKVKGKRQKSSADTADGAGSPVPSAHIASQPKASDWGPLEPLHAILGPAADILGPLLSPVGILSTLLLVVTILWMRSSYRAPRTDGFSSGLATTQRLAAYDQLWRREESQLWDWLEDRMRLDEVSNPLKGEPSSEKQKVLTTSESDDELSQQRMSDRQVDEAIRVTEEKLQSLKAIVDKKKAQDQDSMREPGL